MQKKYQEEEIKKEVKCIQNHEKMQPNNSNNNAQRVNEK